MATPTTYGSALRVPGSSTSRRLPRVTIPDQLNILGYEGLVYAFLPEGGLASSSPMEVVDRVGGLTHDISGTAPEVNRNASGDGRMGLSFSRDTPGRLTSNFVLPESYHIFAVINVPDTAPGTVKTIMSQEETGGDDLLFWVKQDAAGDNLDLISRHGTSSTLIKDKAVPVGQRTLVQAYYDSLTGLGGIFVGNSRVDGGTLVPHSQAQKVSVGGATEPSRHFEGDIEAIFVFDRSLFNLFADNALNTYRSQFVTELADHLNLVI